MFLNLLSVGAAYGLLVLVFQEGVGAGLLGFQTIDTIEAWVPLFLFSVLFGLSMDYQVFLLSRIRERFDETGDTTDAVTFGVGSTARIITGAALIIVAVFSGFARGDLIMFQQMGFGVAVALLIDATIIRSVLLPSVMKLLGEWNWYLPRWLDWLPRLQVEGASNADLRVAVARVATADAPRYGPPDALLSPRYGGVKTFARCPLVDDPADVDVAVLGIPFDTATTNRPGARFGPEAVRSASIALRPYNAAQRAQVFGALSVADLGDVDVTPGNAERTVGQIAEQLEPIVRSGARPLCIGGDHLVVLGELRAQAAVHGPRRRRAPRRARRRLGRVLRGALLPRLAVPAGARGGPRRPVSLVPRRACGARSTTRATRTCRASSASRCSRATSSWL